MLTPSDITFEHKLLRSATLEDSCLLGCDAVLCGEYFPTFRRMIVSVYYRQTVQAVLCLTLKKKALRSFETSGATRHILSDTAARTSNVALFITCYMQLHGPACVTKLFCKFLLQACGSHVCVCVCVCVCFQSGKHGVRAKLVGCV